MSRLELNINDLSVLSNFSYTTCQANNFSLSLFLQQHMQMKRTLLHFSTRERRAAWGFEITCSTSLRPARVMPNCGNGWPGGGSSTLAPPSAWASPRATWAHLATSHHWACFGATTSLRECAGPGAAASSWRYLKVTCLPLNYSSTPAMSRPPPPRLQNLPPKSLCGESMTVKTFAPSHTEVSTLKLVSFSLSHSYTISWAVICLSTLIGIASSQHLFDV